MLVNIVLFCSFSRPFCFPFSPSSCKSVFVLADFFFIRLEFFYLRINTFSLDGSNFHFIIDMFSLFLLLQGYTISCCMFMYRVFLLGLGFHRYFYVFSSLTLFESLFFSSSSDVDRLGMKSDKISQNIFCWLWWKEKAV